VSRSVSGYFMKECDSYKGPQPEREFSCPQVEKGEEIFYIKHLCLCLCLCSCLSLS